jgi:hypothetical protein
MLVAGGPRFTLPGKSMNDQRGDVGMFTTDLTPPQLGLVRSWLASIAKPVEEETFERLLWRQPSRSVMFIGLRA